MPDDVKDQGLIADVEALCRLVDEYVIEALPELALEDARRRPVTLVSNAVLHRQISGIRGSVALIKAGLGHLSLPLVRTACEERIWLGYLFSLSEDNRHTLISLMVRHEGSRMVGSQQQYFGTKIMKQLGFSRQFVNAQRDSRADVEEGLAGLGRALGWKAEPGHLPSKWLGGPEPWRTSRVLGR